MTDTAAPIAAATYSPTREQQAGAAQALAKQNAQAHAHAKSALEAKIDTAASNFESMFMSQMMQFVWSGAGATGADENFGGGHAEEMWRGMLVDQFGSIASKTGNLGIADKVKAEMLRIQAAHQAASVDAAQEASTTTNTTTTITKQESAS